MKTYRSALPQAWFAAGAAAMTALVISLAVVVPATITLAPGASPVLDGAVSIATEVAIVPHRIEVFATRLPAAVASDEVAPARSPKS